MTILFLVLILIVIVLIIPFIMEMIKTHNIKSDWEQNNKQKAIDMLIEDIKKAKKRFYIYGGRGDVYNDPSIIKEIIKSSETGTNFEIILESETLNSSGIGVLKNKDNIFLRCTKNKKLYQHHFRVVDYNYVYIEKAHAEDTYNRYFKRLSNTRFLPGEYSQIFYKIRESVIAS